MWRRKTKKMTCGKQKLKLQKGGILKFYYHKI